MKIKTKLFTLLCLISCYAAFGQDNDNLFSRLQGISNSGVDFYNVDGIEITTQQIEVEFTPKNISKKFKQLKIKTSELISADSTLGFDNYYVFKTTEEPKGVTNNFSYYFIQSNDKKIVGFSFASINKTDKELERKFVRLIKDNAIPKSIFNSLQIDSINFVGRKNSFRR